jgi:oligopeptide transport system ATP-binding protein
MAEIGTSESVTNGDGAQSGDVILSVKNLWVSFGTGRKKFDAVKGVSFDISRRETFGLVGESGSGKTTIGRAIIRVNTTGAGEVIFKNRRINGRISRALDKDIIHGIQMIFQDPMASLNERAKVNYIVGEGLQNVEKNLTRKQREERVEQALRDVGLLPEFSSRFPHEFSGGQRQRIGLARALIMNPSLIIADEPISALDVSIRAQVLNLLAKLQRTRNLTLLFISHDLSVMRFICDRIAVIHKGIIVEMAETETLFRHALHPYTKSLLSAVPLPNPVKEKKKVLVSYDPSCHNYSTDLPKWTEIEGGHFVYGNDKELEGYRAALN